MDEWTPPEEFFRQLDETEKSEFIQWAVDNFKPGTDPDPLWHPEVRHTWDILQHYHDKKD